MSDEQRRTRDDALPLSAQAEPQLVLIHSRGPAQHAARITLGRDLLLIGRAVDDGAGISTGDARMSRVHVRIFQDPRSGGHRVADAHSSNGTFVNGLRVDAAVLGHGDVLRIGDSVFVYSSEGAWDRTLSQAEQRIGAAQTVALFGERAVGKRRFADTLHVSSGRSGQLMRVNCAELVATELSVSALFERHAGPGGSAAVGGTLVLERVDACPLDVQLPLLRALEAHDLMSALDVAVIAVSDADPAIAHDEGRLQADLSSYLTRHGIEVPPLRARKTELLGLLAALAAEPHAARALSVSLELNANAAEALVLWPWPGNLEEVQALLAQCASARPGRPLDMDSLRELAPQLAAPVLTRKRGTGLAPR